MSARNRDGIYGFLPQLVSDLPQLPSPEAAQRVGLIDPIEQRCFG
jgi:hypothetical protein